METLLQLLFLVALLCVIDRTMLIFEEFAEFFVPWIEMMKRISMAMILHL